MTDLTRIIIDEKVFLVVDELCKILEITREQFNDIFCNASILKFNSIDLISECDYNNVITSDNELIEKNGGCEEMTLVSSLRARFDADKRLLPLKKAFNRALDVEKELEENLMRAKKEVSQKIANHDYYDRSVALLNNKEFIDISKLEKQGLKIQYLSEINLDKSTAGLSAFLVGKGIFYHMFIDESAEENWNELELKDGAIHIPVLNSNYEWEEVVYSPNVDRDFRNYSLFENIEWCLTNLDLKNEWQDELNYNSGAINFFFNIQLIMKFFNPNSFRNMQLIEGKIEFED